MTHMFLLSGVQRLGRGKPTEVAFRRAMMQAQLRKNIDHILLLLVSVAVSRDKTSHLMVRTASSNDGSHSWLEQQMAKSNTAAKQPVQTLSGSLTLSRSATPEGSSPQHWEREF